MFLFVCVCVCSAAPPILLAQPPWKVAREKCWGQLTMGQELSCGERRRESGLFHAVQDGELELVEAMVEAHPSVLELTIGYGRLSALHVAAANGRIQVSF